jgi:hypothetical protein
MTVEQRDRKRAHGCARQAKYYVAHRKEIRRKRLKHAYGLSIEQAGALPPPPPIPGQQKKIDLLLGPVLERVHGELLDPAIVRIFAIMSRVGAPLLKPCSICGGKATSIDHDHKTGKVRGGLCKCCNLLLGLAKDSPLLLVKAAAYLMDHGKEI